MRQSCDGALAGCGLVLVVWKTTSRMPYSYRGPTNDGGEPCRHAVSRKTEIMTASARYRGNEVMLGSMRPKRRSAGG